MRETLVDRFQHLDVGRDGAITAREMNGRSRTNGAREADYEDDYMDEHPMMMGRKPGQNWTGAIALTPSPVLLDRAESVRKGAGP